MHASESPIPAPTLLELKVADTYNMVSSMSILSVELVQLLVMMVQHVLFAVSTRESVPIVHRLGQESIMATARYTDSGRLLYVCMDRAYEPAPNSGGNHNAGHFDHIEAKCDSLPCPLYVTYKELTCTVCTK